jgi:chromosome partitioning protein
LEEVEDNYDIVLIDCPPQLGFITLTALSASTGILVTVVPGMLDIASMSQFLKLASETLKAVGEALGRNVSWDFMKFLITRYEPSDGPQTQMAGYLRAILPNQVLTEPMLKSTAISDAGMTQQTIYEVDPSQFVRKTLERAVNSINAVADELEEVIQTAWGR